MESASFVKMKKFKRFSTLVSFLCMSVGTAAAQEPDKNQPQLTFKSFKEEVGTVPTSSLKKVNGKSGQYHLLNPTPPALMREMATDRPDKTESPYTVDVGHYQMEMSLLGYTYDHDNPQEPNTQAETFNVTPMNLKGGLLNSVDLQLVIDSYISERTQVDSEVERKNGFGDLQTRLKINLWGNDSGSTALAVMPFVKFPTNGANLGNDTVEGGVIIPLAVALPNEWNVGVMTEFDVSQNAANEDYHVEFVNTITFSHSLIGDLNGYLEFFSKVNKEDDIPWVGTVDTGLTYALTKDIQLDAGMNIGVTRSADDLNPFCGLSIRY